MILGGIPPWKTKPQTAPIASAKTKPVFVYKLITENTVEEKMFAMQERKRDLANSIYGEGAKQESLRLTSEDLTALFEPL